MINEYKKRIDANIIFFLVKIQSSQFKIPNGIAKPTYDFNIKGKVAGKAFYHKHHISLNLTILSNPKHTEDMLFETLGHELAHIFAYQYAKTFGVKLTAHGKLWQEIMVAIGLEPKRCHNFDVVKTRTAKTFFYTCSCRTHEISSIKHNRCQESGVRYICKLCKTPIVLKK